MDTPWSSPSALRIVALATWLERVAAKAGKAGRYDGKASDHSNHIIVSMLVLFFSHPDVHIARFWYHESRCFNFSVKHAQHELLQ